MLDRKKFEAKIGSIIGLAADFDYEDYDDKDDMGSIVARVDLKDLPRPLRRMGADVVIAVTRTLS